MPLYHPRSDVKKTRKFVSTYLFNSIGIKQKLGKVLISNVFGT